LPRKKNRGMEMRERTFFADIQPIILDFSAIQRRFELFRSINSNDNYYSRFRPFAKWSIIPATLIPALFLPPVVF